MRFIGIRFTKQIESFVAKYTKLFKQTPEEDKIQQQQRMKDGLIPNIVLHTPSVRLERSVFAFV